jgi:hypothetical protein
MSQIEITILKQGLQSRNVLTCCFFTVGEAYRDFSQYIGNLKRFLLQTEPLKQFEVRIYTDDTGKDIALEVAENKPRVSVLHYNCPDFREGKGHVGMFGTLVRFLPMFEDLDTVWSSDIDIPDSYIDPKIFERVKHLKAEFMISTYICYDRKVWGRKYTILAGRFISRIQLPRALLTRFLNNFTNGKMDEAVERINVGNTRKPRSDFPYGMDELFLNTYVYNWLSERASKVLIQKDYLASEILFLSKDTEDKKLLMSYYYGPSHSKFVKIKKLLEKLVPEFVETHPCYKELQQLLPSMKESFIRNFMIPGSEM